MAIIAGYGLFLIENILPQIKERNRMLGISRMSIGWHVDEIVAHLERTGYEYDKDMAAQMRGQSAYTSAEFFKLLGFSEYEDIDFDDSEGATIIHDMNLPLPAQYHQGFDFVFENGTLEHIFDIRQAIANIAATVKVGGYVSHGAPMDAFNHGFYNFSVNFFNDFYRANGFDDLQFYLVRYSSNWFNDQNVQAERLEYTHEEFYVQPEVYQSPYNKMYIACLAHKVEHVSPARTPVQAAYDRSKGLSSRLNSW
jgi:SAM-dependent methyltransferase